MTKPGLHCVAMLLLLLLLPLLFLNPHFTSCHEVLDLGSLNDIELDVLAKGFGTKKVGDFSAGSEMDSEANRRVLMMQRRYISYETLRREMTPCGTAGASYYDCYGRAAANPYNRGCEVITRCARDVQDLGN